MILTDREIRIALETQQIVIDPAPQSKAIASTAVDLTLARTVSRWSNPPSENIILSPGEAGYSYANLAKNHLVHKEISQESGYVLTPDEFILAWTEERIDLHARARLAARVEGKSSLARLGIGIHVTAPTIHAGFRGQIQLEIKNQGPWPVRLLPGMAICQLILEQTLGTPDAGYQGTFLGQSAIAQDKTDKSRA